MTQIKKNQHGGPGRNQGRKPKEYLPNNISISASINEEVDRMITELIDNNQEPITTSEIIRIAIKEKYYKDIKNNFK